MTENSIVMCCICGKELEFNLAVQITIRTPDALDEIQNLFCHKDCIDKILYKDVPRHPDLFPKD
jgi:hypothetical protein